MQIFAEIDTLHLTININSHITITSYFQNLITNENFKFSNFNPFSKISQEIDTLYYQITKIISNFL